MTLNITRAAYPPTRRDEFVENLHGHQIADPYRWLEDADSPETADWVRRQNEFTASHLAELPGRSWFRRRMSEVLSVPQASAPRKLGGRYFVSRNDGTWNHDRWYMAETLEELQSGKGKMILDPNQWSADGSTAIAGFEVSDDGKSLIYVVSEGGSDWSDYRLLDLDTGTPIVDAFIQSKGLSPRWLPDNSSYVYTAPMKTGAMTGTETEVTGRWRLLVHQLGTPEDSDQVLLDQPEIPNAVYVSSISHDRRWLVVQIRRGTARTNRLWVLPLADQDGRTAIGEPLRVVDNDDSAFEFIRVAGERLYCRTDLDADRKRIVSIDLAEFAMSGTLKISEIVPEADDALISVLPTGDELLTVRLVDAVPRLDRYSLTGEHLGSVATPHGEPILYAGTYATPTSDEYIIAWTTLNRPDFPLRGTVGGDQLLPLPGIVPEGSGYEPEEVVVTQAWATSRDGTRVPYFVARSADQDSDAPAPTLLWGYGGFGVTIGTGYFPELAGWLSAGGTVAIANLRGGGEFGTAWHSAGKRANKQNVFDDFTAVCEHLKSTGVTGADQLVITGVSNGGLTVGAVLTQRPDLAAVALPAVGVLDVLRFHKFTFGAAWISDYGDPEDPEDFEIALAYSPVHNARPAAYPATMVTTGDHDDRVVPSHSHKFTATLQSAQLGSAPILIRVETGGGHGQGAGKEKLADELSDMLSFAAHHSGLSVPAE